MVLELAEKMVKDLKKTLYNLLNVKSKPVEFNDNTLMYFGENKGTKLANLPDHHCRWLLRQDWIKDHKDDFLVLWCLSGTMWQKATYPFAKQMSHASPFDG